MKEWVRKSKKCSYALRHNPQEFGLTLDKEGWVDLNDFLRAMVITRHELETMMESMEKQRFEVKDGKIRAFYGHSIEKKIEVKEMTPPETLYHGTTPDAFQTITKEGLKPMSRQYVHLSNDVKTAILTGKRRTEFPAIILIDAKKAHEEGVKFYYGNQDVWLADYIDPKYFK